MRVNWRRGLLRTWFALSGLWIVLMAGVTLFSRDRVVDLRIIDVEIGAAIALVPPIALFIVGALIYWAARGFWS